MIYYYLWVFAPWMFRIFFRSLSSHGIDNIPKKGPILFAVNHPNSFVDAIVIGSILKRYRFWTLVRGDVFNSRWKRGLLRQVFLLPIFRKSEGGRENMAKNDATFEICHRLFQKKQNVLIFAEGLCVIEKRLRPLGKGTARVALGAEEVEEFSMGVTVVPVGVNYTAPGTMNQDVMVGFGKALPLADYKELHQENKAKAVNKLTKDIKDGMSANIVIIPNPENDALTEQVFEIARPQLDRKWFRYRLKNDRSAIDLEKAVANGVDALSVDEQKFADFQSMVSDYRVKLDAVKATSRSIARNSGRSIMLLVIQAMLFPLGIVGYLLNWPPYRFSRNFADSKIKQLEFYDSVFAGLWLVTTTLVWYPIIVAIGGIFGCGWWTLLSVIVLGFTKNFHQRVKEENAVRTGFERLSKSNSIDELRQLRGQILSAVGV